jgi:hypothetical protein
MATNIDPDCAAGIDCEGCRCDVYCPQRDSEQKRRQQIAAYRPTADEVQRSERQGDLIALFRAEY